MGIISLTSISSGRIFWIQRDGMGTRGRTLWEGTAVRKMGGVEDGGEVTSTSDHNTRHRRCLANRLRQLLDGGGTVVDVCGRSSLERNLISPIIDTIGLFLASRLRLVRPFHWVHCNIPLNPEDCRSRETEDIGTQADEIASPQSLLTTDESPERPTSPPLPARSERSCPLP